MTRFALGRTAHGLLVVAGDHARPLPFLVPGVPDTLEDLLPDWDTWCDRIEAALEDEPGDRDHDQRPGGWAPARDKRWTVPVAPPTIYACGANYYDHVQEMGGHPPDKSSERVFHFLVPPAALCADGAGVRRPAGCEMLDYEVEIAAVLRTGGTNIDREAALAHVAAYTIVNDVSLRDPHHIHPIFGANFLLAKGQMTMKPIGPVVVPARFLPDPQAVALSLTVDGHIRQNGTTATMIWTLAEQIAALSEMVPLRAGDLVMTGTPAGTSAAHGRYLSNGETMIATVAGIGSLTNPVLAPSW